MIIVSIINWIILFSFIAFCIYKYGLLPSYAEYSVRLAQGRPNFPIWAFVNIIISFLMFPIFTKLAEMNDYHFIGLFAPAYFMAVAPALYKEIDQYEDICRTVFMGLCAPACICWIVFVSHTLYILLVSAVIFALIGFITRTLVSCKTLWCELTVFLAIFLSILSILL